MDADALRHKLAMLLRESGNTSLGQLAQGVDSTACWGSLGQWLRHACRRDSDLREMIPLLIECNDARAWLVFLGQVRSTPQVLSELVTVIDRLPRTAQCALVSLEETEPLLDSVPDSACAAARAIACSETERLSARAVYAAHIAILESMRWGAAPPAAP